jgi:hypothetical protein
MTRRAFFAACVVLLVWTAPAWPHNTGAREDHVLDVTLSRDAVRIDYDITINQPGHSRTMTDVQAKMFETRSALRVGRLLTVAVDGQALTFQATVVERTPTFEKYRFDAPLALTEGLHQVEVFDMNLAYQATGAVTFHTAGDVRLPRVIEDEPLHGPVLFKFGVGMTPPPQEIIGGKPRLRAAAAPAPPAPARRWPWVAAGGALLACGAAAWMLRAKWARQSRA